MRRPLRESGRVDLRQALRAFLLIGLLAPRAGAQVAPVLTLTQPLRTIALTEHSGLPVVRPLTSGGVVLLFRRDAEVYHLSREGSRPELVGRQGAGPGEYRLPNVLLPLPGDSTLLFDAALRRLILLAPDGGGRMRFWDLPKQWRLPPSSFHGVATDARGMLYGEADPIRIGPAGPELVDSAAIERWNFRTGARDTLARIEVEAGVTRSIRSGMVASWLRMAPFRTKAQWAVAPDGVVAIVRPYPYRVEFIAPNGRRTIGPQQSVRPVPLTPALRQRWLEDVPVGGPPARLSDGRVLRRGFTRQDVDDIAEWPTHLPTFVYNAVRFSPDGLLWVERTTSADAPPTYDVFDRSERVVVHVQLTPGTRVIGFPPGFVLVAERDPGGQDRLHFLAYPKAWGPGGGG